MINFLRNLKLSIFATYVGKDEFNNKYYESKKPCREFNRKRRWVEYNGIAEASKVPHQWFNWLHYQIKKPPMSNKEVYSWEKKHKPNLTGTVNAYFPSKKVLTEGSREKTSSDYEPWQPNENM